MKNPKDSSWRMPMKHGSWSCWRLQTSVSRSMKILPSWGNSQILRIYASNVAVDIPSQTRVGNTILGSPPRVPLTQGQVPWVIRVQVWWVANLVQRLKHQCRKDTFFSVTPVGCFRVWGSAARTLWSISLAAGRRSMETNRCLTSKKSSSSEGNDCERLIRNFYYIWFNNTTYLSWEIRVRQPFPWAR